MLRKNSNMNIGFPGEKKQKIRFLKDPILDKSGWWLTYPSEQYESVGMMKFPIYGKIRNVPNHQPDLVLVYHMGTCPGLSRHIMYINEDNT
jgi:hypothetical protein